MGSEMCIRDRGNLKRDPEIGVLPPEVAELLKYETLDRNSRSKAVEKALETMKNKFRFSPSVKISSSAGRKSKRKAYLDKLKKQIHLIYILH